MLNVLLMYFSILGLVALSSRLVTSRYRAEYPISLILVMVALYVFGFFQLLSIGLYVVLLGALVGGALATKGMVFQSEDRFVIFRQAAELAILFALAWSLSWGSEYWVWDEFSHWGAEAEYLVINKNLPVSSESLVFPNYIPGISLVRYFSEVLMRSGPSSSYFITWLFALSAIYSVSYSSSHMKWALTIVALFFAYLGFFQTLPLTLLIDPLQSLLLLLALRFAQNDDDDSFRIVVLAAVALVLLKHVGIILGGFVWLYYVCVRLLADKRQVKTIFSRATLLLASVVLTFVSWEIYVYLYDLSIRFAGISIMFKGAGLVENFSIGLHHVLRNFYPHAAFLTPAHPVEFLTPGIPLWEFTCIVVVAGFLLNFNKATDGRQVLIAFVFLLFSAVSYMLFLAYVAVASRWFNDLYSFSRYFIAVLFAVFFLQYFVARDGLAIWRCALIAALMVGLAYVTAPSLSTFFVQEKRPPVPLNAEYQLKADQLIKHTKGGERILYVDGKDSSFGYFMFRLKTLTLRYLPYPSTSFVNNNKNNYARNYKRFRRVLCKFDYVYVDGAPDGFWKRNARLFDVAGGRVYKVHRIYKNARYCTASLLEK
ncbi:hypothetical protein ABIA54_003911 [Pseudomonas sp. EB276 TE3739]|uniref:hypothetical protein n=1 Tax=Pseudomonas TaxID=286 RepID=UPI00209F49A9|nr:hypothetical protein [Pseudomonas koreensis]MCP1477243.1 hypothetical protein [Pseudomonas koreensis]